MKDVNGFHVDVAQADVPRDMTIIRMNVDNFDEAYEYLTAKGFNKFCRLQYEITQFGFIFVQME